MTWEELNGYIACCKRCALCNGRHHVVIGKGTHNEGGILLVGEGPGEHEDLEGVPFVGQAGRLLDLATEAAGLDRNMLYIANIIKCRPPENRDPLEEEANACLPFLRAQFQLLKPKVVVAMGRVAMKYLLNLDEGITSARGKVIKKGDTIFIPTYHPAAILRDESKKIDLYKDLVLANEKFHEIK